MRTLVFWVILLAHGAYPENTPLDRIESGPQSASDTLEAKFEGQIGCIEGPDDCQFGVIGDLAADRDGRVFVLDPMYFRVQVYDTTGSYLRPIGRRGSGPGEFLFPRQMAVGPDGTIAVSDDRKMVFLLFSSDGVPLRNARLSGGGHYFDGIGLDAEQRVLDGRQGWGEKKDDSFVIVIPTKDEDASVDTIPIPMRAKEPVLVSTPIGYRGFVPQPFSVRTMWAALPDGRVVATDGKDCAFHILGLDSTRVVHCVSEPVPIPPEERERGVEATREAIRLQARAGRANPGQFLKLVEEPSHYPAILHLTVAPDGRIWLAVPSASGQILFKVFSRDGAFLAHVRLLNQDDLDLSSIVVGGDWMYGRGVLDSELGVQEVRRFRLPPIPLSAKWMPGGGVNPAAFIGDRFP